MRTDIRYVNRRGESIELGGSVESLHYLKHELRNWEWSYSTGKGSGRVTSFSRRPSKPTKVKLPVGIAAKTAAEGIELRNLVLSIGETSGRAISASAASISRRTQFPSWPPPPESRFPRA